MDRNMRPVIDGLRQLASWLEQHPTVPATSDTVMSYVCDNKEEFTELAREMGSFQKKPTEYYMFLEKHFSGEVIFRLIGDRRNVCERVVVGSKIVQATPEIIIPAKPEHEEDIVEWRCAPILEEKNGETANQ